MVEVEFGLMGDFLEGVCLRSDIYKGERFKGVSRGMMKDTLIYRGHSHFFLNWKLKYSYHSIGLRCRPFH